MNKVFVSYSREDQDAARHIADRLGAAGFEVFFDTEGIVSGASWEATLSTALQQAAVVLVLLSSNSRRSTAVQDELQTALENKKLVIPVLLDEGARQNWLWPLVAKRQSLSLDLHSRAGEDQLDHLVSTLTRLSKAPEPTSSSAHLRTLAIAIVSAILGALAVWLF